ncbi:MAG: nucleoside triphosphate pyrophosphohydrolase [Alphaproteobacteria bacterium]|nr:nucleoside triphosphate pyrophosphohydrolase [Alphaproteobacteria bacterium]
MTPAVASREKGIDRLRAIMRQLRDPERGCPWDRLQTFETIAPYTVEEAYEVAEAIRQGDRAALKDELGDLLLQVIYHSQLAEEDNSFSFDEVVDAICDKMIRRHPHVFGDATIAGATAQSHAWEEIKAAERAGKRQPTDGGVLGDVPLALPALTRAEKLQQRAARVGFDWPDANASEILDKMEEEIGELRQAIAGGRQQEVAGELGDLLFAATNLARRLGVNPEDALRGCNAKFVRRFRHIEMRLAERGLAPQDVGLADLESLWLEAKEREIAGT